MAVRWGSGRWGRQRRRFRSHSGMACYQAERPSEGGSQCLDDNFARDLVRNVGGHRSLADCPV